jgi:quinoprotein glucose dehydrogenase
MFPHREPDSLQITAITLLFVAVLHVAIAVQAAPPEATAVAPSLKQPTTVQLDQPDVAATQTAERAIGRFKVPEGLKVELFAAEPLLANPVAFCFDERGRIFVAETHRVGGRGVEDNRGHMYWLDDDLAAMTVEDRVAYMKKHHPEKVADYTRYSERVKLIEDSDGDGRADRANIFAEGFNDIADGAAAGVLARNGDVYFTCIPHLWKLRDTDGDGRADQRQSLHYGYGVRFAFFGHDLHGLTIGPDGRLYFSIGDRGFNITTKEGKRLINPDSGGVLRCELDGSNLEVFCIGLRNPQELVFDDYGNLFTCDNNSDSGDEAKWYYLVEGADYGWRMHYQYLPDRGPWNREKLWHPQHAGQAAYIIPCIANITDGPSGITYYPGTGLGDEYRGHFFVCDFRGGAANSCVFTWTVKPKGASFELAGQRKFLEGMLATDCDFGADGGLYITDWIDGWTGLEKGRIYRVVNPAAASDPRVQEVRKLLTDGFARRPTDELAKLLGHVDRRVRMESQLELASRNAVSELTAAAKENDDVFARMHAIWGLGQLARRNSAAAPEISATVAESHDDASEHIRAQVARVLGEIGGEQSKPLRHLLHQDQSRHVRHLAAIALGKQRDAVSARAALIESAMSIDDDPVLRHSVALGLATARPEEFGRLVESDRSQTRMAVLLAWRRWEVRVVARFLSDSDPRLVVESARAIHDMPIEDAMTALAAVIDKAYTGSADDYDAFFRRVLNANFRLGTAEHAAAIAAYAGRRDAPEHLRTEALDMLGKWARPSPRDRVLGSWRPLAERDASDAATALRSQLAAVFSGSAAVRRKAAEVASALGVKEVVPELVRLFHDNNADAAARAAALAALGQLNAGQIDDAVKSALSEKAPELRIEARRILARRNPEAAVEEVKSVLNTGTTAEKQAAFAALGVAAVPEADKLLSSFLSELTAGRIAPEVQLDLVTAVRERLDRPNRLLNPPERQALRKQLQAYDDVLAGDPAVAYRLALAGGDAERGREVFFGKVALSCVRCHKINETGGEVGPDLTRIAVDKTREYLLESLVDPNKAIAKGFETAVLTLDDGRSVSGIVKSQDAKELTLINAEAQTLTIPIAEILERTTGQSAMPADLVKQMSLSEMRDLVEYLSALR